MDGDISRVCGSLWVAVDLLQVLGEAGCGG